MQVKSQPWVHSWYGDSLGFFLIPISFLLLATFSLPPFGNFDPKTIIYWVLIIDWAHIFAQWHRIYCNPLETKKAKWIYPVSYLALIPLIALYFQLSQIWHVETFLIYFVIFHFIKQHYGFIRIYSKIDGAKTKFESTTESAFIYLCMWTPVLYWHIDFPKKNFYWFENFIKNPVTQSLFYPAIAAYVFCLVAYVVAEVKRSKRNQVINWPKNIALSASALGWGLIAFMIKSPILIFFTVVLTHDISYIFLVWFIGRRDVKLQKKEVPWYSWWSVPGFAWYMFAIVLIGQTIMALHGEIGHNLNRDYFLVGKFFNDIPYSEGWWQNFGYAIFYATQAHHYFIDKFLWKKEKDLSFMMKTGQYVSPDIAAEKAA
jgi:hypothetical protein